MNTQTVAPRRIGWPLLSLPDETGRIGYPSLDDSVRQRIKVILLTRPGEQLMRPEFGGGLDVFLHDPNTLTTRRRIKDAVTHALEEWEPRIAVDAVDVWEIPNQPTHLRVEIIYRLRHTGAPGRMGLSLELGG